VKAAAADGVASAVVAAADAAALAAAADVVVAAAEAADATKTWEIPGLIESLLLFVLNENWGFRL
jgi:hypothetical protein